MVEPEGLWAGMLRVVAQPELALNIVTVELTGLQHHLIHTVAAGQGPDAVAEIYGPRPGLAVLDGVALDHCRYYHSTDLLRRGGRPGDARHA